MLEQELKEYFKSYLEQELADYGVVVSNDINYDLFEDVKQKQLNVLVRTSSGQKSNIAGVDVTSAAFGVDMVCTANDLQEVLETLHAMADNANGQVAEGSNNKFHFLRIDNPTVIGSPQSIRIGYQSTNVVTINLTGEALSSRLNIFGDTKYYIALETLSGGAADWQEVKYVANFNREFDIITENNPLEGLSNKYIDKQPIALATTYTFTCVYVINNALFQKLANIADGISTFDLANLRFKKNDSEISVQKINFSTVEEPGKIPTIIITLTR